MISIGRTNSVARGRVSRPFLFTVLLTSIVGTGCATVPMDPVARQSFTAGTRAYDLGHYEKAIDEFRRAHERSKDRRLLYNIAQSYRMLERWPECAAAYQEYLAATRWYDEDTIPNRARSQRAECQEKAAKPRP